VGLRAKASVEQKHASLPEEALAHANTGRLALFHASQVSLMVLTELKAGSTDA
jgi:hypothetical protein